MTKKIQLDSLGRKKSPFINDAVIIIRLPRKLHTRSNKYAHDNKTTPSRLIRDFLQTL